MAQCPVCQSSIKEDFGLITCPSCGSSVLLDMDGQIGVMTSESSAKIVAEPLPNLGFAAAPDVFSEAVPTVVAVNDMSEVADFANSDSLTFREGSLRFNLNISGLDSSDLRTELRDIITDQKFLWDPENIMAKIRNGELRLEGLSAVKCSILVQRLRSLPVDVTWEQYAIQQT